MNKNCPNCGSEHLEDADVCECGHIFARAQWAAPPRLAGKGWTLSIVGDLIAIFALFFFDPSVPNYSSEFADRINNTGLMQQQLMIFLVGCFMALTGAIFLAADAIIVANRSNRS